MTFYRCPIIDAKGGIPAWLDGMRGVLICGGDAHKVCAVGVPADLFGMPAENSWRPVRDGWEISGELMPDLTIRAQEWADLRPVHDMRGVQWMAPRIYDPDRNCRAFRCSYGADWLPALSKDQQLAVDAAKHCREMFLACKDGEIPIGALCEYAAQLLTITHHTCKEELQATTAMDEVLALRVCLTALCADEETVAGRMVQDGALAAR